MKLLSINVGRPREVVDLNGRLVRTSIWKTPIEGRVRVTTLNIEGDQQSDLSVHGGRDKAVYAYPSEHYPYWRQQLSGMDLSWGIFGENLTTQGLLEDEIQIGDRLRIGSAEFSVTQPRLPCFKLGIRFGSQEMIKRFQRSGRSGFYLAVVTEGELSMSDPGEIVARSESGITVREIGSLYAADTLDLETLRRLTELPGLASSWREHFRKQLSQLNPRRR